MSPSCKMHERLWIDTGPLISLHRQLPHSGVEPTPMAATAATQIRGQEEGEQSAQATRGFSLWGGQDDCGLSSASSKQHLAHTWCFPKTLKSACKTGTTAGVEAWRVLFKTHHRWEEVFVCVCVYFCFKYTTVATTTQHTAIILLLCNKLISWTDICTWGPELPSAVCTQGTSST